MRRPKNYKPLTREQINRDPELYEAVGQYIDAGELDDRYIAHRMAGLNHFLAKEEAFFDVKGRDYPYGRPGPESARDRSLYQSGLNARMAAENPKLKQTIAQLQEELQSKGYTSDDKMDAYVQGASLTLAGLLAGGLIGRMTKGNKEEDENVRAVLV